MPRAAHFGNIVPLYLISRRRLVVHLHRQRNHHSDNTIFASENQVPAAAACFAAAADVKNAPSTLSVRPVRVAAVALVHHVPYSRRCEQEKKRHHNFVYAHTHLGLYFHAGIRCPASEINCRGTHVLRVCRPRFPPLPHAAPGSQMRNTGLCAEPQRT